MGTACTQSYRFRSTNAQSPRIERYATWAAAIASVVILIGSASGQASNFSFLQVAPSARAAALGGSLAAVPGDLKSFLYNPALVGPMQDRNLSVSYLNHLADIHAGFAAYAHDFGPFGVGAAALRVATWGEIDRTDIDGVVDGSFSATDFALTIGGSRAIQPGLRYGINAHYAYAGVDKYRASALLLDGGLAYHNSGRRLTVAAAASHIGVVLSSLGEEQDRLPMDLRVAVSKRLRHLPLFIHLTAYELQRIKRMEDSPRHLILGGEFQFTRAVHIRFGYNHRRHVDLGTGGRLDMAGIGLGFGLNIATFRLDYAYSSWSFAALHQLSFQVRL